MIERTATCACGTLTVTARDEPVRISLCHCGACKRRSGSAFGLNAWWPDEQVAIVGEAHRYERRGEDGGNWVHDSFCPTCGVRMFYRLELRPGMVGVPVGVFADRDFPPPAVEVYGELAMRALTLAIDPQPLQE